MEDTSLVLQDAYGRVQLGRLPSKDIRELASVISACINSHSVTSFSSPSTKTGHGSDQKAREVRPHSYGNIRCQLTLLSLSLVEKMSVKLLDHELPQDLRLYTKNMLRVLNDKSSFILSIVSCV